MPEGGRCFSGCRQRTFSVVTVLVASGAACASAASLAYVGALSPPGLRVLDTATNTIVTTIPLTDNPSEVAVTPDGKFAYVSLSSTTAGGFASTVAVISTATGSVIANIGVGEEPHGLGITPDGRFVYVANANWNSVSVISTSNNSVIATIPVGSRPEGVAVTPDGALVYVANLLSNNVSIISVATNAVVNTISAGSGAGYLTIAPDGAFVYTSNHVGGTISVIDTATNAVVSTIPTAPNSGGIAITPDGRSVYVSSGTAAAGFFLSAIDTATNTVTGLIPESAAGALAQVAVSPDGGLIYVSDSGANTLTVIATATNSVVNTIPIGQSPSTVAFAPTDTGLALSSVTFHGHPFPGAPTSGIVTLNAAAASGGSAVSLASNNPSVTVPNSVVVPSGSRTGTFTAATSSVLDDEPVIVTATYNSLSKSGTLTATPAEDVSVASVSVEPAAVVAGLPSTGSVTLTGPAPVGGIVVELWTDGSPAFVPPSVTIPAGSSAANFAVTTIWTSASQPDTITAFYRGDTKTTAITVHRALSIASVTAPNTVTGGDTVSGYVMLNAPAPPGGTVVDLWTSGFPAFVPISVTIAAGTTSSGFAITTVATLQAAQPVITAFYNGASTTAMMTVTPTAALSSVSATQGTVIAGDSGTGTVTLTTAAPAGGLVVDLWTDGFPAFVPPGVTVPAGATTATFPVTTIYTSAAAQSTITAFYNGVAKTAATTIVPAPTLASISAPAAVISGTSVLGSVSLSGPAPSGGLVVSLWTSGFPAFVPTSVTIPAGTTTAGFTITTVPTSQTAQPLITAFYKGAIKTVTMPVAPTISHDATLSWNASTTPEVSYNIYRAAQGGGLYSKINAAAVKATGFVDSSVAAGQTYYYVVTAVTLDNVESIYSNQAVATIPSD